MTEFFKNIAISRLKNITFEELMDYSQSYGFSITAIEARKIINYLRQLTLNPFALQDREQMVFDLSQLTNAQTAKKAQELFKQLIKQYGMEHLFED